MNKIKENPGAEIDAIGDELLWLPNNRAVITLRVGAALHKN